MGVLVALERAEPDKPLIVVSDSLYVIDGLVGRDSKPAWSQAWQRNGWRKSNNKPVENSELWKRLVAISKKRNFRMKWQRGHAGHAGNEAADRLAKAGAARARTNAKN